MAAMHRKIWRERQKETINQDRTVVLSRPTDLHWKLSKQNCVRMPLISPSSSPARQIVYL